MTWLKDSRAEGHAISGTSLQLQARRLEISHSMHRTAGCPVSKLDMDCRQARGHPSDRSCPKILMRNLTASTTSSLLMPDERTSTNYGTFSTWTIVPLIWHLGNICRKDFTIGKIGIMLGNKYKRKVDKTDEVRKTMMAAMRNLANLFIEFERGIFRSVLLVYASPICVPGNCHCFLIAWWYFATLPPFPLTSHLLAPSITIVCFLSW